MIATVLIALVIASCMIWAVKKICKDRKSGNYCDGNCSRCIRKSYRNK
ncbi:TPA: FeoB-associated Cys-rich membrane protein [Clostridium sporogenes]